MASRKAADVFDRDPDADGDVTGSMRGSNLTLDKTSAAAERGYQTVDRNQLSLGLHVRQPYPSNHNGTLQGHCLPSDCKTDQLLQRQQAQAMAVIRRETHFNLRCLWVGWVFMCWVSGMMAAAGFLLPYWLKGNRQGDNIKDQLSDLGLFRLCAYPRQINGEIKLVMDCGHYKHFVEIPSPLWKLAFILMSISCCLLLLLTFFLAFAGFKLYILKIRSVITICGLSQCISAVFIGLCCLLYPAGWDGNPDVEQVCGRDSGAFRLGHCHLGWAYVLACAGGFLCAITVGFPFQIARQFKEDWAQVEEKLPLKLSSSHHGSHTERQPLHTQQNGGKYNYVVYHNLHHVHPSRPNSICTCASDPNIQEFMEAVEREGGQMAPV